MTQDAKILLTQIRDTDAFYTVDELKIMLNDDTARTRAAMDELVEAGLAELPLRTQGNAIRYRRP